MTGREDEEMENGEEGLDESEEFAEDDLVTFVDEDGNEEVFAILAVVEVEGKDYAVLAKANDLVDDDVDVVETHIFAYTTNEEGEEAFSEIEDDATYEKVQAAVAELMPGEEEDS